MVDTHYQLVHDGFPDQQISIISKKQHDMKNSFDIWGSGAYHWSMLFVDTGHRR